MTALAEGQKAWVKSKQRCSVRERGSAARLRTRPGTCTIKLYMSVFPELYISVHTPAVELLWGHWRRKKGL